MIKKILRKFYCNKHFKIAIASIGCAIIFALVQLRLNPQFFDLFILFFIYLFSLVEIMLSIWNGIVVKKLNKTIEINVAKTIMVIVVFYLVTLLIALSIYLIEVLVWWLLKGFEMDMFISHLLNKEMVPVLVVNNFILLFGVVILLFYQWLNIIKQKQKEKEEKLVYQYQTLKNQLNPHFLFNSLNILSSIISSRPELAETFVYKLSSIYRYVLNSKQLDLIDLDEEIKFAQEYFYLNKIRDEEKINLKIQLDYSRAYKIVPISIQILIENSLKHNSATRDKPLNIIIEQNANNIKVSNNLQKKNTLVSSSKLGLLNLNERLKLLMGNEIKIEESQTDFAVTLPLMPV